MTWVDLSGWVLLAINGSGCVINYVGYRRNEQLYREWQRLNAQQQAMIAQLHDEGARRAMAHDE